LKDIKIQDWPKDPDNCFVASAGPQGKPLVLCACPFSQQNSAIVKTNWIMDIEHFRDDCAVSEASSVLSPSAIGKSSNPTDMLLGAGVDKEEIIKL